MPCASYHSIMNHACNERDDECQHAEMPAVVQELRNQGSSRASGPIERMIVSMTKAQVPNARMRTSIAAGRSFGGSIR